MSILKPGEILQEQKESSAHWLYEIKDFCIVYEAKGWREEGKTNMQEPITKKEFIDRLDKSILHFIGDAGPYRLEEWRARP